MSRQFENPAAAKVEHENISNASAKRKIDHVAETAAEKSSKTEQKFDKVNSTLFSK